MKGGFENPENAKEGRFQTCPNESRPNVEQNREKGGFETHPNQKQTQVAVAFAGGGAAFENHPNKIHPKIHGIPEIVRALKTFSARKINECRNSPGVSVWQRNYWERIVRNERALQAINRYIQNNPLKWQLDHLWSETEVCPDKKLRSGKLL